MKATIARILIIVILLTWAQIFLVVSGPMHPLHSDVCAVDLAVIAYCVWTLASMFCRKRGNR
jgi:ABC-type thiamin/hydroxymethylpyrimidine transport system permease subunit